MAVIESDPTTWAYDLNDSLVVITKHIITTTRTRRPIGLGRHFSWQREYGPNLSIEASLKETLAQVPVPFIERATLGVAFPDIEFEMRISEEEESGIRLGEEFDDPTVGRVILDSFTRYYQGC